MPYSPSGSSPWYGNNPPTSLYGPGRDEQGRVIPFNERGRAPVAPPLSPTAPYTPPDFNYDQIGNIINQINAQGQQAQLAANYARIPFQPQLENQSSQFVTNLYNDANRAPGDMFANISTQAAENAVAGGYAGSPFGGVAGLRLNEEERIRRGGLASQLHSAAIARNPGYDPANPMPLVLQQYQQAYGATQNQLDRDQRERIENARMANQALQNRRNIQAYNNRSYGPTLPTDYGSPGMGAGVVGGAQTNIPEDPNRFGPYQLPGVGPNIGMLDNWNQMSTWQQDDYNRMLSQNPYFGMPDYMNPYSGDELVPGVPGWNAAFATGEGDIPYYPESNVY